MRIVFYRVQLEKQNAILERIAQALERMMPALPRHEPPERLADLSDLRVIDREEQWVLEEIKKQFAADNNVMPDSEAFYKAVKAYEEQLRDWQGQEAVDALPWNRIGRRS